MIEYINFGSHVIININTWTGTSLQTIKISAEMRNEEEVR